MDISAILKFRCNYITRTGEVIVNAPKILKNDAFYRYDEVILGSYDKETKENLEKFSFSKKNWENISRYKIYLTSLGLCVYIKKGKH